MSAASACGVVPFAGHGFTVKADPGFRVHQMVHLLNFSPELAPAPTCPCGRPTTIRVHHSQELFRDRMMRLAPLPARPLTPFRGERYVQQAVGEVTWWRPAPGSGLPADHMFAREARGRLHIVLDAGADRGERYLLRMIREVAMRCAESRGWALFHASAAAVGGHGVLVAGPSGAGKTTVLTALAARCRADLIASDRAAVTGGAASVVGIPLSVRIAGGTLAALGPGYGLPPHRRPPGVFGSPRKVSCTPQDFAHAFGARVREEAPLRLIVLPRLTNDDHEIRISFPAAEATAALASVCCTPDDEDWLTPWFARRTRPVGELRHRAGALIDRLVTRAPVMALTAGVHTPHLLERVADAIARRLP
ncbi:MULTISPECIES: hypothetical protein [Streptomyces]|uniref:Hpr(Ser) kinase/phosphatase n=2 Tax=Streptomyces TaxID=1883 RepID=A0A1I1P749_9ACTN|nr:hypothetical protein [Streptomyces aidingensis]SFD01810.1 hypothetical protein SAMN05421773_108197 [Streptomyces aidingensis]